MNLYSYVVRYDSGFAPNPFYGYCTLATCKPRIRRSAQVGDWIVGSGSADQKILQGGRLVYAMKVSEVLTFNEYFSDDRFQQKQPLLTGSRKQARGDNVYYKKLGEWLQLDSFHSQENGTPNQAHIKRDTGVDKVLISDKYIYYGANGPLIPGNLNNGEKALCHKSRGMSKFDSSNRQDNEMIVQFIKWLNSLSVSGYVGHPYDWQDTQ